MTRVATAARPVARAANSFHNGNMPRQGKPLRNAPPLGDAAVVAIYAVIRRIPKGWVATYGQVAAMAGLPRRARLVGTVLQQLGRNTDLPWHRVVNAKGEISFSLSRNGSDALQQRLLKKEGVKFDARNRFDLERFRWHRCTVLPSGVTSTSAGDLTPPAALAPVARMPRLAGSGTGDEPSPASGAISSAPGMDGLISEIVLVPRS